jgi:hypothetical protein
MGVPHRGGYRLMPEELLNRSNIHILHHPLACSEVAQVVKPNPSQACLFLGSIERSLKTMPGSADFQSDEDRWTSFQAWEGGEDLERELG